MNKHTLNYHTRLHDWYRQHSIQLQKQELLQQHQQQQQVQHRQQQTTDPAGTGEVPSCEGGNLTQDKLHAIHDWCADVNRNLFRVKKREAPPLFRRCRVTSASTIASGTSSAGWGRRQASGGGTGSSTVHFRSADPRRVRSADVFTVTGHWARQPKARVNGGELLAKRPGTAPRNVYSAGAQQASTEDLDLCIRNSRDATGDPLLDAEGQVARPLPRVNHDSLYLRSNALVLKQNGARLAERLSSSPRDSHNNTPDPGAGKSLHRLTHGANRQHCESCKPAQNENARRAKSAGAVCNNGGPRLRFMDQAGEVSKVLDSNDEGSNHQPAVELAKNAKNSQYSRQRPATSKAGGRLGMKLADSEEVGGVNNVEPTQKLPRTTGATGRGEEQGVEEEATCGDADTLLQVQPGFCNTCSGIYSGQGKDENRETAAASPACGNCIHGINVDSTQQLQRQVNQLQQQKHQETLHIRKQHGAAGESLAMELRKTEMELSKVESRLSENGIHYSAERAGIREESRGGLGSLRPGTTSTAGLRARLAAQMALDEDDEEALEDGVKVKSEYSDDGSGERDLEDSCSRKGLDNELTESREKRTKPKNAVHVTIVTDGDHDGDRDYANNNDNYNSCLNPEEERGGEVHVEIRGVDQVPIPTYGNDDEYDREKEVSDNDYDNDEEDEDMEPPDMAQLARARGSGSGRRKSISFTYKPVIAAPSMSNGLLNVLSIDDCKFHMRYSPHKILEEHEITENLMVPLALLQFNDDDNEEDDDDDKENPDNQYDDVDNSKQKEQRQRQIETNSKVAMRISRSPSPENNNGYTPKQRRGFNSNKLQNTNNENTRDSLLSPNTSIRSSTARKATATNVRKYRAMHDPDDVNYLKHQRPRSACLARAFNTLIHDRTIMQRIDSNNHNHHKNNNNRSHISGFKALRLGQKRSGTSGKASITGREVPNTKRRDFITDDFDGILKVEGGPRYRVINAALRRHMGELMQEQCKKLQVQYQRQRNAGQLKMAGKKGGGDGDGETSSPTPSLSVSLSLESLPETKKGILKPPASPVGGDASASQEAGYHELGVAEEHGGGDLGTINDE